MWAAVDAADVVVHAGDWVSVRAAGRAARRGPGGWSGWSATTTARRCGARLPEVARVELAGVRLAVVHETGAATGRERRCDAAYPDLDVLVFGHSHIPWDTTTARGLRLLNPGSPTDRRRQPTHTWMTVELAGGACDEVTLHHLERG